MSRNVYFDSNGNEYYPLEADEIYNTEYCETCIHASSFPNGMPCSACIDVRPMEVSGRRFVARKPTRAQHIREMSTRQLAQLLFDRGNCTEYCYGICSYQDDCDQWHPEEFCINHIVEWLDSPMEEGDF